MSNEEQQNVESPVNNDEEAAYDQGDDKASSTDALNEQLAAAQAKAEENWDLALRTKAEMENLQRRSARDVENAHKFALERFANELLPVLDSLEMGIQAAQGEGASVESLREGTELTLKMFKQCIEKFGIQALHPVGEAFNPEHHQAMTMIDHPDHGPNMVVDVMQKGYLLNDRLIRPAMVVVSKSATKPANTENSTNVDEEA